MSSGAARGGVVVGVRGGGVPGGRRVRCTVVLRLLVHVIVTTVVYVVTIMLKRRTGVSGNTLMSLACLNIPGDINATKTLLCKGTSTQSTCTNMLKYINKQKEPLVKYIYTQKT